MPGIKFDIIKCSIDEDQLRVATQWAKTFIYNPPDIAKDMTQLVMACIGRGDFKVRDFMSPTPELHAPSQYLSIADYLSHASRIIIDYNSLSETHIKELLAYFPEASPSNKVFSRSATHDVGQLNDQFVEGKGFMLGVKGQLPALIKTPRDFGINIAMGGAGQENFNGMKISANGFSGHFYFHRNTEHKLLLVGLEQSAPSSALSLIVGREQYPEDEQQGHDQFGQGHSLTGASDTYTAAGSLYFSDPIYQAKLVLEKGGFPPDKYGAMQVTLTNDNWPLINSFLEQLRAAVASGNEYELLKVLLEKPSTAIQYEAVYNSYVALDFSTYLKQAYKIFIHSSELDGEEQSNLLAMQGQLLFLIKELQFGNLAVFPEFEEVINTITKLEYPPKEYIEALGRISDLFARQLSVDPKLENTQIRRPYQFGDITHHALNSIHYTINGGSEVNEHLKEYEFGDITSGLLSRLKSPTSKTEPVASSSLNEVVINPALGYRFGDITRHLIWGNGSASTASNEEPKARANSPW